MSFIKDSNNFLFNYYIDSNEENEQYEDYD